MIKKGKNGERYFEKQYEAQNERFLKHEKYSEKIYKVEKGDGVKNVIMPVKFWYSLIGILCGIFIAMVTNYYTGKIAYTVISFFLGMGIIAELLRKLAIFRPVVISMGMIAAVAWSYFLVSIIDGLTDLMHYSLPRPVYYTILILAIIRYGYKNFWIALAYVERVILERYCTQTSDHVG